MRTLRLSTNRQAVLAGIAVILGSWTLLSSSLVMSHSERIRAKNVEIKDARVGYEQLLAQVSIYKERVADLTKDLETNYNHSLALVGEGDPIFPDLQGPADSARTPPQKTAKATGLVAEAEEPAPRKRAEINTTTSVIDRRFRRCRSGDQRKVQTRPRLISTMSKDILLSELQRPR